MEKYAIYAHVTKTDVPGYSNNATQGVGRIARSIRRELNPVFKTNIANLENAKVSDITKSLRYAIDNLNDNGICFFYFHGHGDSKPGIGYNDEITDEVLICNDGILYDDEIDGLLRLFKPTQRILSVVDSCSSNTVVEWSRINTDKYPEIIHIASAKDDEIAGALPNGGIFSNRMLTVIIDYAYTALTYQAFYTRLENFTVSAPCIVTKSGNVSQGFLNKKLFT